MKKYTPEELKKMDENADVAVKTMTIAGVGIGFAPVFIDITALMASMGVGVIAVGKCYDMKLNKEDVAELIKQFFKAAGLTFSMIFTGQKLTASILKSNPVTYIPTMVADAIMCGSVAFAVGSTSKKYFSRLAMGKKATDSELKQWMQDGKTAGKSVAKGYAEEKAKEYKKNK